MSDQTKLRILDPIPVIIAAYKRGEIVIMLDDSSRENEGDFIIAAEKATEESIAFMARYGCGLICIAMTSKKLNCLGLTRMPIKGKGDKHGTAFMESVDAKVGISTGISASDRVKTIQALMGKSSRPENLVSPGHMFPLEAAHGGVLERPGHTEAAIDLAKLAKLNQGGVICEILSENGKLANLPSLQEFAEKYRLKISSIPKLVAYRRQVELKVELLRKVKLPTHYGLFELLLYKSNLDQKDYIVLIKGELTQQASPLVRVHSQCLTGDVFGSARCDCGLQVSMALKEIEKEGHGVLIYMQQEGRGIGLSNKIHAYALQDEGLDTVEANQQLGFNPDNRNYDVAAKILNDIGIRKARLMTNNPQKVAGLIQNGISIIERIPLSFPPTAYNKHYLKTKKEKLGHIL